MNNAKLAPLIEIKEITPDRAPDTWGVFVNGAVVWEFGYEHQARELSRNLEAALGLGGD